MSKNHNEKSKEHYQYYHIVQKLVSLWKTRKNYNFFRRSLGQGEWFMWFILETGLVRFHFVLYFLFILTISSPSKHVSFITAIHGQQEFPNLVQTYLDRNMSLLWWLIKILDTIFVNEPEVGRLDIAHGLFLDLTNWTKNWWFNKKCLFAIFIQVVQYSI